ncbi:hypothetical protein ACH0BU_12770 [Sphingomonas olei]
MDRLSNLLLSHIATDERPQLFAFGSISRRNFLRAGGMATTAALTAGCSPGRDPVLRRVADGVEVAFGGATWMLDPGAFAPGARVTASRVADGFAVRLLGARLAGTDLRVDLTAEVAKPAEAWIVRLHAPHLGLRGSLPLEAWLAGTPVERAIAPHAFRLGAATARLGAGSLAVNSRSGLSLTTTGPLRLDGTVRAEAEGLALSGRSPAARATSLSALLSREPTASTELLLDAPRPLDLPPLSLPGGGYPRLRLLDLQAVRADLFDSARGAGGAFLLEGASRLSHGRRDRRLAMELERTAMFAVPGQASLAGRLASGQRLMLGGTSARLAPSGGVVVAHHIRGRTPEVTGSADVDHLWLPGAAGEVTTVDLGAAPVTVPIGSGVAPAILDGGDPGPAAAGGTGMTVEETIAACVDDPDPDCAAAAIAVAEGGAPGKRTPVLVATREKGRFFFGADTINSLPLDDAKLSLRRGSDMLNLTMSFEGYDVLFDSDRPRIKRRNAGPARIVVELPPQHIWETVHEQPQGCPAMPAQSQARMSKPSRLAFDSTGPEWKERALDIDLLLDWRGLTPIVDKRASARAADGVDEQLALFGIDKGMTLSQLFDRVAAEFQPPGEAKTSLEIASRLSFSPAETGRWLKQERGSTPANPLEPNRLDAFEPLWNVRLDQTGRRTVRALWSSYMIAGRLPHHVVAPDDELAIAATVALTPKNHWDILSQNSVFGLPALRSIVPEGKNEFDLAAGRVPRANVVRPIPEPTYLREADRLACKAPGTPKDCAERKDTGIAIAMPFDDADITLTSLGAIVTARWEGEPPHLRPDPEYADADLKAKLPRGVSLEQLVLQEWLGRDIRVVAFVKGYLYPLGMRAAYVTVAERRFYLDPSGKVTSYEVLRRFIRCRPTPKRFPALNQPFDGRDFPTERVVMRTLDTPDLAPPDDSVGRRLRELEGDEAAIEAEGAFWPRVLVDGATREFRFQWATDSAESVQGPLLFVASEHTGRERRMRALARYYRERDAELRSFKLNGARHRYAPEERDGEARFDTDSWTLSVRGQLFGAEAKDESFTIDARMNGADQPPFYPVVESGQVTVQSVDTLSGRPQGLITVAFEERYVRHGFDKEENKSEVYLRVLAPAIAFDVQKRADLTGGASGASSYVAALSRKTGVLGGRLGSSAQSLAAPARAAPGFVIDKALVEGKFDPSEFFGFKGAKLLGLIEFKDLIQAVSIDDAPKLLETIGYGALEGALPRVKRAAELALAGTGEFFRVFDQLVADANAELARISPGTTLRFEDLYPDLARELAKAKSAFATELTAIKSATSLASVPGPATRLIEATQPVLREFDRLARDPLPPAAEDVIRRFQAGWQTLRDLLASPREAVVKAAERLVAEALRAALCPILDSDPAMGSVLFGSTGATCEAFLRNPADVLANRSEALIGDALAKPLGDMLSYLAERRAAGLGDLRLAEDAVRRKALDALQQAANALDQRLASYDAARRDIRTAAVRLATARAIAKDLAAKLENDLKAGLAGVAERFATNLADRVATALDVLADALPPGLDPQTGAPYPADILIAEVKSRVAKAVADFAADGVAKAASALGAAVQDEADAAKTVLLERVTETLGRTLTGLLGTVDFVRIARLGRQAAGWCDDAVTVAHALGDGVSASATTVTTELDTFRSAVVDFKIDPNWPAAARTKAAEHRERVLKFVEVLAGQVAASLRLRARLLAAPVSCGQVATALDALQLVLRARVPLLGHANLIVRDLVDLQAAVPPASRPDVAPLVRALGDLVRGASGIAGLPTAAALQARVRTFASGLPAAEAYRVELEAALATALATARDLDSRLKGQAEAARLATAIRDAAVFAEGAERRLVALIFQSVALDPAAVNAIETAAAEALRSIAKLLSGFHRSLANAFTQLMTFIDQPAVRPVVTFVLGEVKLASLQDSIAEVLKDDGLLESIAQAGKLPDILARAEALRLRWSTPNRPALLVAFGIIAQLLDDFVAGNLGNAIALRLRQAVEDFGRQLRDMLVQLVPTQLSTDYDWSTDLGDYGPFKMLPRPDGEAKKPHLRLTAKASVDLVTGRREASAYGELQPFMLDLLPGFPMATIHFHPLVFKAGGGAQPNFDVRVAKVQFGALLKFIEALKAYMQPDGSGFYMRPTDGPVGVEAGFEFAAGLIQVGSLSFLNVSLRVAARLYFDQSPAEFIFSFASEDRPFIISNPPYGGGGYAELKIFAGGEKAPQLTLSFMFGGAAQLKFGPLQAQGRIMAGFGVRRTGDGTTLWAVFEAVGEGSIACFSISVALRVVVWHYANGVMRGETTYRFKFKVGFVSFSYSVTASYRIAGGSGGTNQTAALKRTPFALACDSRGQTWKLKVATARKDVDWSAYRRQIDHSLL